MFRLIIALGIAGALMPEDIKPLSGDTYAARNAPVVSTTDTLHAANSLYQDVTTFCERNEEACLTGKAIASSIASQARSAINSFSSIQGQKMPATDKIVTGAIKLTAE